MMQLQVAGADANTQVLYLTSLDNSCQRVSLLPLHFQTTVVSGPQPSAAKKPHQLINVGVYKCVCHTRPA